MISGGLEQYVKKTTEVSGSEGSGSILQIEIECPTDSRMDVLEDLWARQWEITRSGPIGSDYSKQLIIATKSTCQK